MENWGGGAGKFRPAPRDPSFPKLRRTRWLAFESSGGLVGDHGVDMAPKASFLQPKRTVAGLTGLWATSGMEWLLGHRFGDANK